MKKRILSVLLILTMILPMCCIEVHAASQTLTTPQVTTPSISKTYHSTANCYWGKYSGTISDESSYKVKWQDVDADYYKLNIVILNGAPSPGYSESTNYRIESNLETSDCYYTITSSDMEEAAGKWIKFVVQPMMDNGDYGLSGMYYFKVQHEPQNTLTTPQVTTPSISKTYHSTANCYWGKYSGTISDESSYKVKWQDVDADYYKLNIVILNGAPSPGYSESTNYRIESNLETSDCYYTITSSDMEEAAGKWIKFVVQPMMDNGDYGLSGMYYFMVQSDTTPLVSSVTPSTTSVYTGKSVTFTATAKNTNKVVFYAKSTDSDDLVYLDYVTGTGTTFKYTRSEGFNRSGTRTIYAYPCDASGNEQRSNGSSTTLSVISRGTLGEVRNVSPVNGSIVLAGSTLRISWSAPSAPSGGAFRYNVIVTDSSDAKIYEATEITNTYVDVPASKIVAGTYSIGIYAVCPEYDANKGLFTSFTAKNDTSPIVSSVTPSPTSVYTGKAVTFTATAKNTTKVVFYAKSTDSDDLVYLDYVTGTGTTFKYTRSEGFNRSGTRTIYAYPCDASGNEQRSNGASTTLNVTTRGTLGDVRNISPINGATVSAGSSLRISWSAPSSPSGGAFRYNVVVTNSSETKIFEATEISNTYVDVPASKLTAGTYSIGIYAVCPEYDANEGTFVSFTAKTNVGAPSVTNITPSPTSVYTGKPISFTATAQNTSKVVFYAKSTDSNSLVYLDAVTGSGTTFKYTRSEGFNRSGTRTIYAYPCDANGNELRSNGTSISLEVKTRGTLGEVRNVSPVNGATVNAGESLHISWSAPAAPSGGAFRYNVIVTNGSGTQIYNATEISNTYVDIPASKIIAGTYYITIYAVCPEYDANKGLVTSFNAKTPAEIPNLYSAKITNPTINVDEELEFVVETSTNANNVLISYDEYNEPLKATAYRYTTSVSGDKKTWKIYLPINTPSPQRIFRLYAAIDDTRSKESAVVTATVIGKANIESDYIEYTPTSPKVGDTITFVVNANQYTDKISLDIGGTEYSTSTSYTDSGYLRKFTISYAFQKDGLKTINFYAWKNGTKNNDSLKTLYVDVEKNNNILDKVTIISPYDGYSHVQGKTLNVSWKNNASVTPDTYSVFLNGTALGVTSDTSFTIDSSLLTTIGEYNIDVYATKEGYTPSDGTRVKINVIASSITTTFNSNAITLVKGDTFAFSGKITSKTLLEKVTITILNVDTNTGETFITKNAIRKTSFDLSTLGSFVVGETYMKEPGNYQIRIFAKEYNNDGIEIANKPIVVSASNALVTKFEASTYNTYTGVDIKFTATASNTKKVIFEVDGYNIGTATGTGTFTLNYTGFNTPGTRTVWAYPCDSNGDAVRTNGKSVTIEVDSYGTIGQAKITYPTSATQINTYEDLTIKWTGANSNCKYNVTVYDPNDDKIATLTETTANELTIDGDEIKTVGTYTVSIYTVCDYYSPSYASSTFYVTAENAVMEGFDNTPAIRKIGDTIELEGTVKVDKGYIETITVNVWGPNSTSIGGKHKSVTPSGNVKTYDISNIADIIVGQEPMDKIGKYWVNVYVRTKGDNEAERVATKEVTVVSESSITLNSPVITSSLDAVKGADYTLTWTDVDNADLYEIKIPDLGFKTSVEKNIEYVKIPKKHLNSTGTYDIEIRAINTKDSSYHDGITSTELIVKETADVMRIIRIEYPETNTVPEGTNLKVKVITDDGRARLSRIGVRHVNNDLSYTWVSTFHAKAYSSDDIENALEWNIEIPVNLLENNRTLTLVLYDFLLIEKDTHNITFNCVENHNTMGNMSFTYWQDEWYDETERPVWWNAPQGLSSAVDYYLADLTHNGETKRIRQNGTDIISGTEPSLTIPSDMLSDLGEYTLTITAYKEGYKKQSVSASFTVKCSHHDKYVKEDDSLIKYGKITDYGNSNTHKREVTYYKRCEKCGQNDLQPRIEIKYESHSIKTGVNNCKFCACGYFNSGNYQEWRGYINAIKINNIYDLNGNKQTGRYINIKDEIFVLGEYNNYYYIKYTGQKNYVYGFVKKSDIKEDYWHYTEINNVVIPYRTEKEISADLDVIIKALNTGKKHINVENKEGSTLYKGIYIESTRYDSAYNLFIDLRNKQEDTFKAVNTRDNSDIVDVYAYIYDGRIYIELNAFVQKLCGYNMDYDDDHFWFDSCSEKISKDALSLYVDDEYYSPETKTLSLLQGKDKYVGINNQGTFGYVSTMNEFSWSISDENIATINDDGLINAKNIGECTLKLYHHGTQVDSIIIRVYGESKRITTMSGVPEAFLVFERGLNQNGLVFDNVHYSKWSSYMLFTCEAYSSVPITVSICAYDKDGNLYGEEQFIAPEWDQIDGEAFIGAFTDLRHIASGNLHKIGAEMTPIQLKVPYGGTVLVNYASESAARQTNVDMVIAIIKTSQNVLELLKDSGINWDKLSGKLKPYVDEVLNAVLSEEGQKITSATISTYELATKVYNRMDKNVLAKIISEAAGAGLDFAIDGLVNELAKLTPPPIQFVKESFDVINKVGDAAKIAAINNWMNAFKSDEWKSKNWIEIKMPCR